MTEPRTPYRTGNEAEENKSSALRDIKMSVMQYQEAGAEVTETWVGGSRKTVLILEAKIDEWRNVR